MNVHLIAEGNKIICRYCHKKFESDLDGESHIKTLSGMAMLQDHIAIHWTTAKW